MADKVLSPEEQRRYAELVSQYMAAGEHAGRVRRDKGKGAPEFADANRKLAEIAAEIKRLNGRPSLPA